MYPSQFFTDEKDNLTGIPGTAYFSEYELNHKYAIPGFPDHHFIIRKDQFYPDVELERVCLYQDNVVNPHLFGDTEPHTKLLLNELRTCKKLDKIYIQMIERVGENIVNSKRRPL